MSLTKWFLCRQVSCVPRYLIISWIKNQSLVSSFARRLCTISNTILMVVGISRLVNAHFLASGLFQFCPLCYLLDVDFVTHPFIVPQMCVWGHTSHQLNHIRDLLRFETQKNQSPFSKWWLGTRLMLSFERHVLRASTCITESAVTKQTRPHFVDDPSRRCDRGQANSVTLSRSSWITYHSLGFKRWFIR